MSLLKKGNMKMGDEVLTFGLPPIKTCTPTKWCVQRCYAQNGFYKTSSVKASLEKNHHASQEDDFVDKMNKELKKSPLHRVRIHPSGDFYSEEYIEKWISICKSNPDKQFLAFTKRGDLAQFLLKLESLPNIALFESLDPSKPIPTIGLKRTAFASDETPDNDLFTCIGGTLKESGEKYTCTDCNYLCWGALEALFFPGT